MKKTILYIIIYTKFIQRKFYYYLLFEAHLGGPPQRPGAGVWFSLEDADKEAKYREELV